jgi:Nickel/cobalt transporter regulator
VSEDLKSRRAIAKGACKGKPLSRASFLEADSGVQELLSADSAQPALWAPVALLPHGPLGTLTMRHRHLLAVLLASSFSVPALAQEVEATVSAETQGQAAVAQAAVAEPEERRERRSGDARWSNMNDGGAMPSGDQAEPVRRREWQQREQALPAVAVPQPIPQASPQPQPDWSARRGGGNEGGGGWQRREAPVMAAPAAPPPPVAPVSDNGGWRGDWQRRVEEVRGTPPAPPPVVRQGQPSGGNAGWRGGDRDGDGRQNWRDRDGDGVRNNRDWDRNNDRRVDGRWDRNNNGVVDRRYDWNRDGTRDNRWNNGGHWNNDRGWHQRWNNDRSWNRGWNNNRDWNRGWRNDRRYDWQRYRYQNRDVYRLPRYYSPYGYGYRYQQFGIGFYLESVLFGSRYRISDPWRYRLPQTSWPYQWVRYYDDVILVDTRNGYVVDVIYNFFW